MNILEQVVPKSLSDIIRKNRDRYELRLSTEQDLAAFAPMVSKMDSARQIRDTINDWRIVCLQAAAGKTQFLTGIAESVDTVWATSTIVSVDFENGLVLTSNSVYRLGSKGIGEPGLRMLMHICACFRAWGWSEQLGSPQIFY